MFDNYNKLTELFNIDLLSQFSNNKDYINIKEMFEKNNETLLDYFTKCIKLTELSIFF